MILFIKDNYYYILFLILLSATQLNAQEITFQRSGKLVAVTGSLKNWQPNDIKIASQPSTRDHRGLIQKQDLPPVPIIRYRIKPVQEDSIWQKNIRKPDVQPIITPSTAIDIPIEKRDNLSKNSSDHLVFPGMNYSQSNPADPSVAVGPDHIIQMINGTSGSALFSINDKKGAKLLGPVYLDQLPGANHNGGGDGVTWYDQFSNRFVMTEFADSSATGTTMNSLIVAVSATKDPLGSWYIYEFFADGFFPDYPKYGNYPEAWFAVTRDFKDTYEGSTLWAFDKNSMLAGNADISIIKVRLTDKDNKYNSMAPVTMAGTNHQMEANKGYFIYFSDNELTKEAQDKDSLGLISFKVNFSAPALSELYYENTFEVAPFSSRVCETRNCAPSPDGQGYDVVSNKIMHKPYLRNWGNFQSIVLNHTVDVNGTGLSGIRWYELQKKTEWTINQQSTFAPQQPGVCQPDQYRHRFLGSIIQNDNGQIALAYNFSSKNDYASLAFTGRQDKDPLNRMTHEETIIRKGTGYGTDAFRWGDYNDISPDPIDDSLFWFTGMTGNSSSTWTTSITAFKIGPKPEVDVKLSAVLSPSACEEICDNKISPVILVSNMGQMIINKLVIKYAINHSEIKTWEWAGTLDVNSDVNIQLPMISLPDGDTKFVAWIEHPDAAIDLNRNNDTLSQVFKITSSQTIPYFEGGETGSNIPYGWKSVTSGSSNLMWRNVTNTSYEGSHSFLFDNFNNNEPGKYGLLVSPVFNGVTADSLELSFSLAAAMYDEQKIDTLEVFITTECGQQKTSVFKKWGTNLSTIKRLSTQTFVPLKSEWRKEVIPLNTLIDKPFGIIFKATNQFGNNIYLDAIQLQSFNFPEIDLSAERILLPPDAACSNNFSPAVIITNRGKNIARNASIELLEGNKLIEKTIWTGNLSKGNSDTVFFNPLNVKSSMVIKGVINSLTNIRDENSDNDTTSYIYKSATATSLPFIESFEQASTIDRWMVSGDSTSVWKRTFNGFKSTASLSANNYGMPLGGSSILSPKLTWNFADSVWLEFKLAAGHRVGFPSDTLKVDISFDCGKSWSNIFNQSGYELATKQTLDPFLPTAATDWKSVRLNLSTMAYGKNEMLAKITNLSGGNNSLFIDQINIYSKDVAADLKELGYKILPNPIKDHLLIQFYPYSVGLASIKLTDASGRICYFKGFRKDDNIQQHFLDLSQLSVGIYFMTLEFREKIVTEKIIKLKP